MLEWWRSIDIKNEKTVKAHEFCDLLIRKGVVNKAGEATRMLKIMTNEKFTLGGIMDYAQYQRIMARVLLRG